MPDEVGGDEYGDQTSFGIRALSRDPDILATIEREILSGNTIDGAAIEAGLTIGTFRKWRKDNELFRDTVDGFVAKRNGLNRKVTHSLIRTVYDQGKDPAKAADLMMKFLERTDEDFTSKRAAEASQLAEGEVIDPDIDDDIQKVMKNAETELAEAKKIIDETG